MPTASDAPPAHSSDVATGLSGRGPSRNGQRNRPVLWRLGWSARKCPTEGLRPERDRHCSGAVGALPAASKRPPRAHPDGWRNRRGAAGGPAGPRPAPPRPPSCPLGGGAHGGTVAGEPNDAVSPEHYGGLAGHESRGRQQDPRAEPLITVRSGGATSGRFRTRRPLIGSAARARPLVAGALSGGSPSA
jgi:hypothetical protein